MVRPTYLMNLLMKENFEKSLKQLCKERKLLKKAETKVQLGELLTKEQQILIQKWKEFKHESPTEGDVIAALSSNKRTEDMFHYLEMSARRDTKEEEKLKREMKGIKKGCDIRRESRKRKEKIKSRTASRFKYLSLKRKYDDLLQYLAKVQRDSKDLYKENETLHSALKVQGFLGLGEKVEELKEEILNRTAYANYLENQWKSLQWFKGSAVTQENRVLDTGDIIKEEWLKKLTETRTLYEKAIQGYKEELLSSQRLCDAFEKKFEHLIKHYEDNERQLVKNYEGKIRNLKREKSSNKSGMNILKLEALIQEKESEILRLNEVIKNSKHLSIDKLTPEQIQENIFIEEFQTQVLSKIDELIKKELKNFTSDGSDIIVALQETLRSFLDTLKSRECHCSELKSKDASLDIENIRERLRLKEDEVKQSQDELAEEKLKVKMLLARCEGIEMVKQNEADGISYLGEKIDNLNALPQMLRECKEKLREVESSFQSCLADNKILEEKLKSTVLEMETKKNKVLELERRVLELSSSNGKFESVKDKLESRIELLESQIERKNEILELNSNELERRIREYSSILSQMERLKDECRSEVANIETEKRDSQLQIKLQELQVVNARLEAQINSVRGAKSHQEKIMKRHVKSLENDVCELKVKNSTLQKNLDTIQSTYKYMFAIENGCPLASVGLPSYYPPKQDSVFNFNNPNE